MPILDGRERRPSDRPPIPRPPVAMDQTHQAPVATDLSETEKELRVASDNFLTRIERLHALEEQTREILEWAGRQTDLAEEVATLDAGDARPIAIIPPRSLSVILDEWRAAER